MHVTKIPADVVFRVFTACKGDTETLILDVRALKDFKKGHVLSAYNVRLAASGKTLVDHSKNSYSRGWSDGIWWDKHVVIYGEEKLKKDHPIASFLAADNHAKSVNVYSEGLDAFQKQYPYLVTISTKANAQRRYPGEIVPRLLYLGDWEHATEHSSMDDLKIRRIISIHNTPENLKPPPKYKQLQFALADVETEDISQYFNPSYEFIEQARAESTGVLVHCGAGVSRSAALCIAYLMRKFNWSAQKARAHCIQRRSIVMPNDGFWRSLCAFEGQLGIQTRSDPNAVSGFSGADTPVKLAEGAAGDKVTVTFVPMQKLQALEAARQAARKLSSENKGARKRQEDKADENVRDKKRQRQEEENGRKDGKRPASETENGRHRDTDRRRHADSDKRRERSIDGDRDRGYGRDRGRDKDRRHRSRSREEGRRRHRSRSRDRDQNPRRDRDLDSRQAIEERQEFSTEELQEAPVVLETVKEGKAIGRLEINMKSSLQRCVFGRLPSNEVVLEHLSISRQHAQLTLDAAGDLFITDLGSAHQTNVDGVWIRPNQPRPLPIGSVFKLGGSSREYKVVMTPRQQTKDEMQRKREADLEEALANAGPSV